MNVSTLPSADKGKTPIDDQLFEDIYSTADFVRSLCVSIMESAYRRNDLDIRIACAEFRQLAFELMGLFKLLGTRGSEK